MLPKILPFLCLFASVACSQLPEDETPPSTLPQTSSLTTLSRLVIPPGVAYTDVYGGLAVSDKPLLISHLCNVPAAQRRFLTPGAGAVELPDAVASWWAGKAAVGGVKGGVTMEAWMVGRVNADEDLKWLAVAALVYCKSSEFYYGNGVDTRGSETVIDEDVWVKLGGSK